MTGKQRRRAISTMVLMLLSAVPSMTTFAATDGAIPLQQGSHQLAASSTKHPNRTGPVSQADLAPNAKSAVVMDYATGKVLFAKNADVRLPMASITKIMTMILIMEALDDGKLTLKDKIKASEYAASMGGSQIFLEPGESMTVEEMMKGIAIASANDACVAMAEHLAGTEAAFVEEMNEKAKDLDMRNTHFANCNGLPAANHYSSARDVAIMSRELLKHKEITRWTSVYSDYLRKDTEHPLWLVNTNKLVRFYDGVDGLKTGYTTEAKYCLSATAKKPDGFRVIAVAMGEPKSTTRNAEVSSMLNWSFSQFESKVLYRKGQLVQQDVPVGRGSPKHVDALAGNLVGVVSARGSHPKYHSEVEIFKLRAPVVVGQKIGVLRVFDGDDEVARTSLVAAATVKRAGFWETVRDIVTFGTAK